MCPEQARIQSVPVFFSAITPGQRVGEAKEWFIRRLSIEEAGPLKLSHSPSGGLTEDVAIPDTLAIVPE
jgi:hypothetical protein